VTNDLDTLATGLYARIDDELKASPWLAPWRPAVGIPPTLSDAELVTLAVTSALLGYTSERRWLRRVGRDFGHLFPYVPQQSGTCPSSPATTSGCALRPRCSPI